MARLGEAMLEAMLLTSIREGMPAGEAFQMLNVVLLVWTCTEVR